VAKHQGDFIALTAGRCENVYSNFTTSVRLHETSTLTTLVSFEKVKGQILENTADSLVFAYIS
jgi:hypothetical protein